jgi:hypothetical protein
MVRTGCAIAIALSLAACASTSGAAWAPRTDASLSTDRAACDAEARSVDINSADSYSSRYGAAAAMAGRVDRTDLRGGAADRVFDAIVDACMTRKGWVRAE